VRVRGRSARALAPGSGVVRAPRTSMKDAKSPSWKTTEMGVSSFSLSSDDVDVTGAGEEVISLFEPARALKERGAAGQGHILRAYS
jgi:hypothetical protein